MYYLLLTTHYSLLTTHYSLLTTHYSPFTTHYSLLTIHYSLFTTHLFPLPPLRYYLFFISYFFFPLPPSLLFISYLLFIIPSSPSLLIIPYFLPPHHNRQISPRHLRCRRSYRRIAELFTAKRAPGNYCQWYGGRSASGRVPLSRKKACWFFYRTRSKRKHHPFAVAVKSIRHACKGYAMVGIGRHACAA